MIFPFISLFDESEFQIPHRGTERSAAVDLRANIDATDGLVIPQGVIVNIPLGIMLDLSEQPSVAALLLSRSGLGGQGFTLMNGVGLIDPDYQGEISGYFVNQTDHSIRVNRGDRIAQLLLVNFVEPNFTVVDAFKTITTRSTNGHGSTGL